MMLSAVNSNVGTLWATMTVYIKNGATRIMMESESILQIHKPIDPDKGNHT